MSIHVTDASPSSPDALPPLKPLIEAAVISALPDGFKVDKAKVTRINFAKPNELADGSVAAEPVEA